MRLAGLAFVGALVSAMLAPAAAFADTRDDVTAGIYRCGRIADDRQWLECLYGAAQPMRQKLGLPPAPESQQILSRLPGLATTPAPVPAQRPAPPPAGSLAAAAPAQPAPGQGFGLPREGSAPTRETSRIADFTFDRFGIFTATLANGQVWQQNSSDETKAHWRKPPTQQAYNVVISESILGSYNFKVIGMPGTYKVRRVK
jgi:hypothetical protein